METNTATTSQSKRKRSNKKTLLCTACNKSTCKGACKVATSSCGQRKKIAISPPDEDTTDTQLNGKSLLKHTKTKVSNVPDSTCRLRPSSETKWSGCSSDATKLPLDAISIGKECLNYDKEAVTVGSSFGSEPNIIFENDFDCVDSSMLVKNESSQTLEERIAISERTPQKKAGTQPNAPSTPEKERNNETPWTPDDHKEYAMRPQRHTCPFCSKTFRSNGKLNSHVFSHTGERPFACKHCHKAFSSKFKLVRHLLIHSEDRKFLCTVCERRFLRNDHLKNHYKVHNPRKVVYRCERPGCEKEYSSALSQRKHEAWHRAQDGEIKCLLCGIKHESSGALLIHLKTHSGSRLLKTPADRKFRCHVCGRNFLTRKDVTRHLVVHTGERDFLCQFCPQRFGRKDHLVRHIKKSHLGPAKRKVSKSILTLNKSKATKTRKVSCSEGKADVEEKCDADIEESVDEPEAFEPVEMLDTVETEVDVRSGLSETGTDVNAELVVHSVPTNILILPPNSILVMQAPTELPPPAPPPNESSLDFFPFSDALPTDTTEFGLPQESDNALHSEANSQLQLIEAQSRKGGDLFEGTSQSLMFSEPSFEEEEFVSSDLNFSQREGESSGELLRYLLQSDADAPLPGFNQIFSSCPPSSS